MYLIVVIIVNIVNFWITPYLGPFFGLVDIGNMMVNVFGITIGFVVLGFIWSEAIKLAKARLC